MSTVTFRAVLDDKNTLHIPTEIWEELGLEIGEEVSISINVPQPSQKSHEAGQQLPVFDPLEHSAWCEDFFERLQNTHFEKPTTRLHKNPAKQAFAEAMEEKFKRLGLVE